MSNANTVASCIALFQMGVETLGMRPQWLWLLQRWLFGIQVLGVWSLDYNSEHPCHLFHSVCSARFVVFRQLFPIYLECFSSCYTCLVNGIIPILVIVLESHLWIGIKLFNEFSIASVFWGEGVVADLSATHYPGFDMWLVWEVTLTFIVMTD